MWKRGGEVRGTVGGGGTEPFEAGWGDGKIGGEEVALDDEGVAFEEGGGEAGGGGEERVGGTAQCQSPAGTRKRPRVPFGMGGRRALTLRAREAPAWKKPPKRGDFPCLRMRACQ